MADPLFRAEVEEMKLQIVQSTAASLATLATKAVATLEPLLLDGEPWLRQKTTTADYDSGEGILEEGDTFQDDQHAVTWRIQRTEPEADPFLARLVCHVEPEAE
jgi:hypothetical protein